MLALNGADQLNGPRQWGSLLFCLVIVLSLQRAEGSTEETGSSYTKIRILPGTEFCGSQSHEYELYLAVEDIDHSRTKTKSPQTNGICERFHRTILDEFYRVAFRKKIYRAI